MNEFFFIHFGYINYINLNSIDRYTMLSELPDIDDEGPMIMMIV